MGSKSSLAIYCLTVLLRQSKIAEPQLSHHNMGIISHLTGSMWQINDLMRLLNHLAQSVPGM